MVHSTKVPAGRIEDLGGCLAVGLPTRIPGNSVCTTFYPSTITLIFREEEEDNFKKFWRGVYISDCKTFFQTASSLPSLHPTKGASLTNIHRPDYYPTELVHSICLLRLPILAAFSQIGSSVATILVGLWPSLGPARRTYVFWSERGIAEIVEWGPPRPLKVLGGAHGTIVA